MKSSLAIAIAIVALTSLANLAFAQEPGNDGTWIKQGLDAYDRVHVTKNPTPSDVTGSLVLHAYVTGILATNRQNNLLAALIVSAANKSIDRTKQKSYSPIHDARVRTALAFTPLLALPESTTGEQLMAILRKYITAHPEKWNDSAYHIVTDALKQAFPIDPKKNGP